MITYETYSPDGLTASPGLIKKEKKKMKSKKRVLTKGMVDTMLKDFKELQRSVTKIESSIQDKMDSLLCKNEVITPQMIDQFKLMADPLNKQLEQYTKGFPSFLRSSSKSESKLDGEYAEKIRDTLKEARELEWNFSWTFEHLSEKIQIHNMALGNFDMLDNNTPVPTEGTEPEQEASKSEEPEVKTSIPNKKKQKAKTEVKNDPVPDTETAEEVLS